MIVSGVAGAEPERDAASEREITRITATEVRGEDGSSSRTQYSDEDSGAKEKPREEDKSPEPVGGDGEPEGQEQPEPGRGAGTGGERNGSDEEDPAPVDEGGPSGSPGPVGGDGESRGSSGEEPSEPGGVAETRGERDEPDGGGSASASASVTEDGPSSSVSNKPLRDAEPRSGQSEAPERGSDQSSVSREADGGARVEARGESVSRDRTVQSPEIRRRVRELRAAERRGELPPAATGYDTERRGREMRIAREQIVVQPVDEASLRRYKELYEEAAEEYGFGDDWYVLAAVGKVESGHGQNMGPSSAGALGPMQFMPSTWDSYGVDANDDGKANIMDPEDAIPSAARYLKAGGAPDDWYEALYTYNHAGWYVEKVLKMAEKYRQAAGDDEVGPY